MAVLSIEQSAAQIFNILKPNWLNKCILYSKIHLERFNKSLAQRLDLVYSYLW